MTSQIAMLMLSLLLFPLLAQGQFPAVCNTQDNLDTKTCCPNNCGAAMQRGSCVNVTEDVINQWDNADQTIVGLMRDAPSTPEKGTADSRYLWPTVVFERVCMCNRTYGGFGCMECGFGWTGSDCMTRKTPVVRRHFNSLPEDEKQTFITATKNLKEEMGVWSVIVEEPANYSSGTVTLQNVTTYNLFVFLHEYIARADAGVCTNVNKNYTIDFAHEGPVFPVWHRRYLLVLQGEFQRIMNNPDFGLPYWQWEENDMSPFAEEYYGVPANGYSMMSHETVMGGIFSDWYTICDIEFQSSNLTSCTPYWRPCNPAEDTAKQNRLVRGGGSYYLPNRVEVMVAIAAPSYDAADLTGQYLIHDPRTSFRSRLEGWNRICSASNCVLSFLGETHVHNAVHLWVGGQMSVVPAAVNDPIFNLHHCNVDRILESWMKRFASSDPFNSQLLPGYVPVSGGHPGHNRGDYIVPFFPLITAGRQYGTSEEWGYVYDQLVPADIVDGTIADCPADVDSCAICDANATCINCNEMQMEASCPAPNIEPPTEGGLTQQDMGTLQVGLGLGLGLGIPLLLAFVAIIILIAFVYKTKGSKTVVNGLEMKAVET